MCGPRQLFFFQCGPEMQKIGHLWEGLLNWFCFAKWSPFKENFSLKQGLCFTWTLIYDMFN